MKHQIYKKYKNFNIYQIKKKRDEYLSISYYISINKLKYKNMEEMCFSYVQYIIDNKNATLIILKTNNKYKRKGYAIKILEESLNYLKNKLNIEKIELDDMSNRSWENNNIYVNFGFKYINNYPEPEMILYLN